MTREEAITVIKALMENPIFCDEHKQAFNIAVHDIKQRHDWDINNLILINKDDYELAEQEPVLDKIREEAIENLKILKEDYWDDDGYGHETKQYDDTMLALDMAIKALEKEPCCNCIEFKRYAKQMGFSIEKESIPYLMHKEMDIPLSECQKAYDVAIEYLKSQAKVKG